MVAAHATAVREAPAAAEPPAAKHSRSPRPSFDRQRDLPLPDEPTTPAQQPEGPFLDAAASSIDSADLAEPAAAAPAATQAVAVAEQLQAALDAQAEAAPAATAAEPAAAAAEPALAALDTQFQQQQQEQPGSPASNAAAASSPRSTDSFTRSAPGNVAATLLVPRAVCGWLLGPNGATARAHQVSGARWHLSDSRQSLGGSQNLRCEGLCISTSV